MANPLRFVNQRWGIPPIGSALATGGTIGKYFKMPVQGPIPPARPQTPTQAAPAQRTLSGYPTMDMFRGDAEREARGLYDPMFQMIARREAEERDFLTKRQQAMAQAIAAAYGAAAPKLDSLYNNAVSESREVEGDIANALRREGSEAGAQFRSQLEQVNAPDIEGQAGANASSWESAAAVPYTLGMNDVQLLISRGAGAREALERDRIFTEQQSMAELQEALAELGMRYGGQREELQAGLPLQIRELQKELYGESWRTQEYVDKLKQQAAEQKAMEEKAYIDQRALLLEFGMKKELAQLDRQFKAQEAERNRQLKADIAMLQAQTQRRGQDITARGQDISASNSGDSLTGPANQEYITVNGRIVKNPNYKPSQSSNTGLSPEQQRLRENRATSLINNDLYNPNTRQLRQTVRQHGRTAAGAREITAIVNASLRQAGIPLNSPEGIRIRRSYLTKHGFRTGEMGNYVGQRP